MSQPSKAELTLVEPAPLEPAEKTRAPRRPPTPEQRTRAAIRRCDRAFALATSVAIELRLPPNPETASREDFDRAFANARAIADSAYCGAMPILFDYGSVRDFIACTGHGILIGAISRQKGGQLLYAAQVALSMVKRKPADGKE
ncbi:MAG: hypothetical protein ACRD3N_13370 [Terracidiphilus sp.]